MSFSLWAMPSPGKLASQLQAEVDALAAEHKGAPRFQPHVTLLGGIAARGEAQVLEAATKLAADLQPYHIDFERVAYGVSFYQCVYLLGQQGAATMRAGALTRAMFGLDAQAPYMPHLSLLYSDMPRVERAAVAAEAQQRLLEDGGVAAAGIDITSVAVWYTPEDKSLESWKLVRELPLGGAP